MNYYTNNNKLNSNFKTTSKIKLKEIKRVILYLRLFMRQCYNIYKEEKYDKTNEK